MDTSIVTDESEQNNEVLALENIFSCGEDDSYRITARPPSENPDKCWTGHVEVMPTIPQPFKLVAKQKDQDVEHTIEHLPAMKLYFAFPCDYPTLNPPNFTLTCDWLTRNQLSKLCSELDARFLRGSPVLFTWAMFLREEALQSLGIENSLHLESGASSSSPAILDPRAVGRISLDPLNLLYALLEFDDKKRKKVFEITRHECDICGDSKVGKDCLAFKCRHAFCRDCLKSYFQVQILENRCHSLTCPASNCDTQALPSQVQEIVGEELYKKYDALLLASSLDKMADVCYCPRTFCQAPVILEIENNHQTEMGRCTNCMFVFCNRCRRSYHGVAPCRLLNEEKRKLYEKYVSGSPETKAELEKKYGVKQIQSLVAELDSEAWLDENSKLCPRCNARIEKTGGCNKMSCWKCGSYFCWLCQAFLSKDNPYAHFSSVASGSCYNQLFAGAQQEDEDGDAEFVNFFELEDDDEDDDGFVLADGLD